MKTIPSLFAVLAFFLGLNLPQIFAQTDVALLRELAEENKKNVDALVLYPPEIRGAILEATKTPELLIRMQDMREKTSSAFRTLIEDFPKSTQSVFYDLSRYPGLIEKVADAHNDAPAQQKALEALPPDKREEAWGVVQRQMPTLYKIDELNRTSQGAFNRLLATYDPPTQKAFNTLLGAPEIIDLLNEDLRFTVLVGETYRDNPAWVLAKMDSLHLSVARAQAEELDSWKNTLEKDPQAQEELKSAAREYATENGYDADYDGDDLYYDGDYYDRDEPQVFMHYYQPYPYWYGYPWWEPFPRWHPYPWWWDWGCHFHHQTVIVVYMPSYHFMHWYFDRPHHHEQYNHLSTHFVEHYYGHRNSGTTITMGVADWQKRNRTVISDGFIADKDRLPQNLKEYGRFESGREQYNAKNPGRSMTQEEYLDKNAGKYPDLQRSRTAAKTEIQRDNRQKEQGRSPWAPSKAPAQTEPAPAPRPPRVTPKTETPKPRPKETPQAPARKPQTQPEQAGDYHRQQWENNKPVQREPQQQNARKNTNPSGRDAAKPKTSDNQRKRGG